MTTHNHAKATLPVLERLNFGEVVLTAKDAAAVRKILQHVWHTCYSCYGTGWKNYRDYRTVEPLAPKVDCEVCAGVGSAPWPRRMK